ncbi:hypothetical protein [Haemophilus paracuniculus]|uniref:hypothetical protein n=1 Tax=Haemophilus paracuniculus TaxID=734 RepID=UPI001300EC21|nr:hypothetical protein [Haemophilus paracuniculus]
MDDYNCKNWRKFKLSSGKCNMSKKEERLMVDYRIIPENLKNTLQFLQKKLH